MGTIHIIGGGISGLAAATWLAEKQVPVKVYEATSAAGGNARSSHDATLGEVDHGLHMITGRAPELNAYLRRIGASDTLQPIAHPLPLPFAPVMDYVAMARLLFAQPHRAMLGVENQLRDAWANPLARLWLQTNTADSPAIAKLLRSWLRPRNRQIRTTAQSLSASFIVPALNYLEHHGADLYFSHALQRIQWGDDAPRALQFARKKIALDAQDVTVLATPAAFSASIIAGLDVPDADCQSITLHFAMAHAEPEGLVAVSDKAVDLIRYRRGQISVSNRVADGIHFAEPERFAQHAWLLLQQRHPYLRGTSMPAYAVRREKHAGHLVQLRKLATPSLPPRVLLAGDWLDATKPATLEAAVRHGHHAARAAYMMTGARKPRAQSRARLSPSA